ncbi:MAG: MerC family mercury resistance protein [Planctomycetota bacterium]
MTTLPTLPTPPPLPAPVAADASWRWDLAGIAASAACAVHCLAAPLLLLFLPAFGAAWSSPWVHWVVAAAVLPLALLVIGRGYRAHRRGSTLALAALGGAALIAGLVLPASAGWAMTFGGDPSLAAATPATECADPACCPTLAVDPATGATTLTLPWATVVTLLGGVLLMAAHAINLQGCACHRRSQHAGATDRDCPAPADDCSASV